MKVAFLALCLICAALLNVLVFTVATGKVPFRQAEAPAEAVPARTKANEVVAVSSFPESERKSINELIKAFDAEKAALNAQKTDLATREESVKMKEVALASLKTEVEGLQKELESHISEVKALQQGNFRRLADTCAKMDPTAASSLLMEMERRQAAIILSMTTDRSAAAIMDATIQSGPTNKAVVAEWAGIIRSMRVEKTTKGKE